MDGFGALFCGVCPVQRLESRTFTACYWKMCGSLFWGKEHTVHVLGLPCPFCYGGRWKNLGEKIASINCWFHFSLFSGVLVKLLHVVVVSLGGSEIVFGLNISPVCCFSFHYKVIGV